MDTTHSQLHKSEITDESNFMSGTYDAPCDMDLKNGY